MVSERSGWGKVGSPGAYEYEAVVRDRLTDEWQVTGALRRDYLQQSTYRPINSVMDTFNLLPSLGVPFKASLNQAATSSPLRIRRLFHRLLNPF